MHDLMKTTLTATVLLALCTGSIVAEPPTTVLLLRNGHVLQGVVRDEGQTYHVTLPHGQIRVKAPEVEHWCRDLQDGYRRKRAAIRQGDVSDHLRLASWCLDRDMLGHAGFELDAAALAEPGHPMIAMLRRRLATASQSEPTSQRPSAAPAATGPSFEELDRLVEAIPSGTVEAFTTTVQPLLANNCTTSGCHLSNSESDFRLMRLPKGRIPSRRLTQRNLYTALRFINPDAPGESPLLKLALQPHGTAKTAAIKNRHSDAYRQLADWVDRAAGNRSPAPTAPPESIPRSLVPEVATVEPFAPAETPSTLQFGQSESLVEKAVYERPELAPLVKPLGPQRGAKIETFTPADPFDPEIFNRRHHAE